MRVQGENDPRVRYRLEKNALRTDRRLKWMLLGALVFIAVPAFALGVFEAVRPDRTESDASFEHNMDCGGATGLTHVEFNRYFLPEPLLAKVRADVQDHTLRMTALVDVRDESGRIGHGEWHGTIGLNQTTRVPVQMRIELDRMPVGAVSCVAWTEFPDEF